MQHTEKPTILVVDDDEGGRYATARLIRKEGFPVIEAATGGKALEKAAKGPGLVVLDVNLPDLDGFEVCRQLKADPVTSHIPVLHLSATFLNDESKVQGLNMGADAYLTQPVEPMVLLATINALLRMKRAETALRASEEKLQSIFRTAPAGIGMVVDRVFMEVNQRFCDMTGYGREELIGQSARLIYPSEEEYERVGREKYAQFGHSDIGEVETRFKRRDGAIIDVLLRSTPRDRADLSAGVIFTALDISARKQAEAALKESEKKFRSLFDNAVEGIFQSTPEGRYLSVNPTIARMLGFASPEEMVAEITDIGSQVWVDPEKHQEMKRLLSENGVLYDNEIEYRRRDGTTMWVMENIRLARDENGREVYEGFVVDITARKMAEEDLRASEARYRNLFEQAAEGVLQTTPEGRLLRVNPALARMYGYSEPEQMLREITDVSRQLWVYPEQRQDMRRRLAEEGRVQGLEVSAKRRDGRLIWVSASIRAVKDADGQEFYEGFLQDVTARKQTEKALALHAKRLQALLDLHLLADAPREQLMDFVLQASLTTMESEYAWVGLMDEAEEVLTIHRWSQEAMAQCAVEDKPIIFPVSQAGSWGECLRRRQAVLVNDYQAPHPGKKGLPEGHFSIRRFLAVPVLDKGRVALAAAVANKADDYTEEDAKAFASLLNKMWEIIKRREMEMEIHLFNLELEQRVQERTAQLNAANKEMESFSYSVSHDLRAPLRIMDGFSLALLEEYSDKLDSQGQDYLMRIRRNAQWMGELIDSLLGLSRLSRSQMRLELVDLSKMAREVTDILREADPERRVEVVISPGLEAEGDAAMLRVLLHNLLENAWKFTGKKAEAWIEMGAQPPEKGSRVFYVRDNGAGFDMAFADKLFGAFQRLHGQDEFPGLGIGLTTVQRIIRRHGGRVWAQGAVDQGAVFHFTLSPRE